MIKELLEKIYKETGDYVSIDCDFTRFKTSLRVEWCLSIHQTGERIKQHTFETFKALEVFANSWIREQQGDFGKIPKDIEKAEAIVQGEVK